MSKIISSKYEITSVIGSGTGGIVYKGRHLNLEKDIVLKADTRPLSETTLENLRREVDALKDLSHTYIPQVFDFVFEGGICYTVMDYIDGESLEGPLNRDERFTSPQVIGWARKLLEALCYLHSSHSQFPYGILHSDIKPSNIMRTPQGDIRLIDFNIALALDKDGTVAVGLTPGYASPEHYKQISEKEKALVDSKTVFHTGVQTVAGYKAKSEDKRSLTPVSADGMDGKLDARSDIYGLGATLYRLVTGRKPAAKAIDVIPLAEIDCAPALAAIINKAMSVDKEHRFQTAAEMLAAFTHIHWNDPRAKRYRMIRASIAVVFSVLLIVGSFTAFTGLKRMQWDEKVRALVEESLNAYFTKGDRPLAIALALEAVPARSGLFISPVSAEAINALVTVLGIYDLSDRFKLHHTLNLPSAPLMAEISPDGKTAAIVYAYETAVVDLQSGQIVFTLPMAESAYAETRFLNNTTLVCAGWDGICAYALPTGTRLWSGPPATAIAVSADGNSIAAIHRDDDFTTVYDASGTVFAIIDFAGRNQSISNDDTFVNPKYNLFDLSSDGRFLAISFADGSLLVYDILDLDYQIEISAASGYIYFEGGFYENLLVFSATNEQSSDFAVFDIISLEQVGGFEAAKPFGVAMNESGIYFSSDKTVFQFDTNSLEARALVYADAYVDSFAVSENYLLVAMNDGSHAFYDANREVDSKHRREYLSDIALLSKDFALLGGRNEVTMMTYKLVRHDDSQILAYSSYFHDEARINGDRTRVTLFSIYGFQLYDIDGTLLCEQGIPTPERIIDQQYSKTSGNLAVIYEDALRIYSGYNGALIFEKTDLQSVFYAPYGVSILDGRGQLRLIDIDNGKALFADDLDNNESFAAYCGITVTDTFLDGRKLIGADKIENGYRFAVSDGTVCSVYDQNGNMRFTIPVGGKAEAFFTANAVVISPVHGTPAAYSLKNGKKIRDLEKDAYLTYITSLDDYIVSQYIYAGIEGKKFGVLLDSNFRPVASLPSLCDISDRQLIFDYPQRVLRYSNVYSADELLAWQREVE